jgi:uncharacterized membrane protein/ribosomal protein L40E
MNLESDKTLGGIGAILLAIPFLNLVGIILLLISMKGMADHYNEDDIFKCALMGFIFGVIGVVALVAFILMLIFGFAATTTVVTPFAGFGLLIITIIVLYVFSLISAIFYRNSLNKLAEKSGEQMLDTAGLVLLIGAIIPVIGEIIKVIAWILAAVGFFSIKESTQPATTTPVASATEEKKFCRYCGAQNTSDAAFCEKCGKKIE